MRQDREINLLNREIFQMAVEWRGPRHARVGDAHGARRRALERIGDNAVDIGEQTAFVVTGLFREFSDSSHPAPTRLTALCGSSVKIRDRAPVFEP